MGYIQKHGNRVIMQGRRVLTGHGMFRRLHHASNQIALQAKQKLAAPLHVAGLDSSVGGGALQQTHGLNLPKLREPRFMKRANIRLNF